MTNPVTQRAYLVANATGTIFPTVVFAKPPAVTDFNYPITQRWIDTSNGNAEWFLLGFLSSAGVVSPNWVKLASGTLTAESLKGNTGAAVFPDGSFNINVVGDSSGIQFAGNPATHTLTASLANIPNSSLAHSSISLVAGTGISITTSPVSLGGSTTISTTASLAAFNQIAVQVFTTPGAGTYTPTTGMKYCTIEVVGGGGGSGGCATTGAAASSAAAGGGAGGYSRKTVAAATIGASIALVVGAGGVAGAIGANTGGTGGTTSVGSTILSASGGVGGGGGFATTSLLFNLGGVGGVGSSGDINTNGMAGFGSIASGTPTVALSGAGGSSFFGGGADANLGGAATAGLFYGGGASGGALGAGTTQITGAAGAAGVIVITEYIGV
jgi:hypothetical protein